MQNVSHVTITVETEVCNEKNCVFFTSKVDLLMFFDKEGGGFAEKKTAFKMQRVYMHMFSVASIGSNSLRPHGLQTARLLCPWNSAGKNTGVGCHFLLQGIFPLNPSLLCLLHCR